MGAVVPVATLTMVTITIAQAGLGERLGGQVTGENSNNRTQSSSSLLNVRAVKVPARQKKAAERPSKKSTKQKKKRKKKKKTVKRPWKKKKRKNKKNKRKTCKEKPLQLNCLNNKLSQLEAKLKKLSSKKQLKKLEKTMTNKINKAMLNLTAQTTELQSDLRNNTMKLEASMTKLGMLESNITAMMGEVGINWTDTVSIMAEMVEALVRINRTVEGQVVEVGEQGARLAVIEAWLNITTTTAATTTTTTTTTIISNITSTSDTFTTSTNTDMTPRNTTFVVSNATTAEGNIN